MLNMLVQTELQPLFVQPGQTFYLLCRQARQELKALKEQEAMFADEDSQIVNGDAEGLL